MQNTDYYTLTIEFGDSPKPKIVDFRDIAHNRLIEPFDQFTMKIRQRIYQTGFTIQTSPVAWELISPFRIYAVHLTKQPEKYEE